MEQGETVPVFRPQLPTAAKLLFYLNRIDESRIYSNHGPLVAEFESGVSQLLGLPPDSCVSACNGTIALVGAILAAAGKAKAERPFALVPAFTYTATALAIELCGYEPYLIDIDPETWILDSQRVSAHPMLGRIGLIVPVAPFGRPVPQAAWRALGERTGIPVVIDGAAGFDLAIDSARDSLGAIPVVQSFHATKSFTSGEGGAVITTDKELAMRTAEAMNFGFHDSRESRCASVNGKMSEYHAAVGLAELHGWQEKLAALQRVAGLYRTEAEGAGIPHHLITTPEISSCYILFRSTNTLQAAAVTSALKRDGIGYRFWYGGGLQSQPHFQKARRDDGLEVTEQTAGTLIGLPVAPDLDGRTVARVVATLHAGMRLD
jgi:dTDP-4-amino-4,6-dideoxygalactose transaminase